MRTAHIVYAHPEPGSFVNAMAGHARRALESAGWRVTFSDLYAKGFNPVASAADFAQRQDPAHLVYSLEQRHAWSGGTLAPDIVEEVQAVLDADLLILAFPVFWFSMPAMMKGWVDRVFLSGTFYGGRRVYDRAGMAGKRALVLTSLGGREHMFGQDAIHGELAGGMLRHILQGTLGYVGYQVYQPFIAYHVPYVSAEARAQMLAALDADMAGLDARPTLRFPSLDAYDEYFRPLPEA
ncbi:NAD(P)H-dependent oxidoreductase [Bordetella petrii]|uniref:NAD(P)H-dependent oxidoreductase n=1 Tax=Bordetella petrii TaxID=94624 RepID=UPI001E4BB018|nr:NAD(P)H-dependent oxidoreductase [Bordetella petrii]MCD0503019.1 NAD(P)H-dependent oxidoreductase [Bordetella petrii]